jgi:hypothetical protein
VRHAIINNRKDFVLLDVRGEELYNSGHIEGAISLPHARISENNQSCGEQCGCEAYQNPLNGLDVEALSVCAIQNIQSYKKLSKAELDALLELPCGCKKVFLKKLIGSYTCLKCNEDYWYSLT